MSQSQKSDSIQVIVRIRGLNKRETQEGASSCITPSYINKKLIKLDSKPSPKSFQFDHVCQPNQSQQDIFNLVGHDLVDACLKGYNACIFAYGQTGAGKTYTMQGQGIEDLNSESFQKNRGLQPRVFEYLFNQLNHEENTESLIQCNYLEIYNEQIFDLLSDEPNKKCCIRESMKKGIYIENITDRLSSNSIQSLNILQEGQNNRHVGATLMNAESSRSHSVFSLLIETKKTVNGIVNVKQSKLHFVDLAGSERQAKTQATDERLKEANNINKSLTVLGQVINSLVEQANGKSRHIPYRDSKLTHILKDSLGGNSKTFMIAAISEASTQFQETLSTLKFAQRAKMIKNKACVNEETSGSVEDLKQEIQRLKTEITEIQQSFPKETPEQLNNQMVQGFINDWNVKIQDIETYVREQLRDFYKLYETQQKQQQEDNSTDQKEDSGIAKDKLQISSLRLNELFQLKEDIEDKLKNSGIQQFGIMNDDIQTPVDDLQTKVKQEEVKVGEINQTQNNDVNRTPVKEGILKKILKGIGKLSAEKSDNKGKQQIQQIQSEQILELQNQIDDINENNQKLQHREQDITRENQLLILQNAQLKNQIQQISQEKSKNEEQEFRYQQLEEQIQEERKKYAKLESMKQSIQQDLETQEEMRIHWENMYYNEHKRYKFNYEIVQDQLEQIEKLKEENEKLMEEKENNIQKPKKTEQKLTKSLIQNTIKHTNNSQQTQIQQNKQFQQQNKYQNISNSGSRILSNSTLSQQQQTKSLSSSNISNSSKQSFLSSSKNSLIGIGSQKSHISNPKNFLKRKSLSTLGNNNSQITQKKVKTETNSNDQNSQ